MRVPRIYTSQALANGATIALEERAAHYLLQVLRMKVGRELRLFNGDGSSYHAVISAANRRDISCTVTAVEGDVHAEPALDIELAIGISKGDRMDTVVQKATELGVSRIVPLRTARVDVKLDDAREQKKWHHWQQVMISACEQCGRNRLVELAPLQSLEHWLGECSAALKLVLQPHDDAPLSARQKPESLALLVGPEGGLSAEEIDSSLASGFTSLRLGPRVLRTETAPLAALSILQFHWGDMG